MFCHPFAQNSESVSGWPLLLSGEFKPILCTPYKIQHYIIHQGLTYCIITEPNNIFHWEFEGFIKHRRFSKWVERLLIRAVVAKWVLSLCVWVVRIATLYCGIHSLENAYFIEWYMTVGNLWVLNEYFISVWLYLLLLLVYSLCAIF